VRPLQSAWTPSPQPLSPVGEGEGLWWHRLAYRAITLVVALMLGSGCGQSNAEGDGSPVLSKIQRIDEALAKASRFLISRQSADGSWRSPTYGAFKEGDSLTGIAVVALAHARTGGAPDTLEACEKGAAYLAGFVKDDGAIDGGPHGLSYPVYTAATAVMALSAPGMESHRRARDAWLTYLRRRQLVEQLGWQMRDREYGGWGFSSALPRRPQEGQPVPPLTESNLSATVFALEALHAAGSASDDPALKKALVFVERCQNWRDDHRDPALDDGGFFFIYDDPVRNKAGVSGKDADGSVRFASYGSMTADGLRALLACGLTINDPRVLVARRWLVAHFRPDSHPGSYAPDREPNREAVYFYYCASAALALRSAGTKEVSAEVRPLAWAELLSESLRERQRSDGSWSNSAVAVREDDPIVATCLAIRALTVCRDELGK
jgi:Prenyltransferase and squalene oxidase repeat